MYLGFEGIHCENNMNECITKSCKSTASCVDGVNKRFCHCTNLRYGVSCRKGKKVFVILMHNFSKIIYISAVFASH